MANPEICWKYSIQKTCKRLQTIWSFSRSRLHIWFGIQRFYWEGDNQKVLFNFNFKNHNCLYLISFHQKFLIHIKRPYMISTRSHDHTTLKIEKRKYFYWNIVVLFFLSQSHHFWHAGLRQFIYKIKIYILKYLDHMTKKKTNEKKLNVCLVGLHPYKNHPPPLWNCAILGIPFIVW